MMSHTFAPDEWDQLSEFPTPHLSFLINRYLTKRNIGFERTKESYKYFQEKFEEITVGSDIEAFFAGSLAEGFSIPNTIVKDGSSGMFDAENSKVLFSDIDVMWISRFKKITLEDLVDNSDSNNYVATMDTKYTHPGYLRLRLNMPGNTADDMKVYDSEVGCFYLLGGTSILSTESLTPLEIEPTIVVSLNGPSIMISDCNDVTTGNFQEVQPEADNVIALHCPSWPPQAKAWPNRERPSGWPDQKTIDMILEHGCHAVPVAYRKSKKPEVEWRLSFCQSERFLATEAVTDAQRQCYIFMKILHHQTTKPMGLISSYHMKNIFLYSCEIIPLTQWEDNPGACVMYMLDELIIRIEQMNFPNYFVPENNMIDYLEEDQILLLGGFVSDLRHNLIEIFLTFTDRCLPENVAFLLPMRYLFRPILEDAVKFKEHRDLTKSTLEAFYISGCTMAHVLVKEHKMIDAIDIYVDLHCLLQSRKVIEMDLVPFLMSQVVYLPNVKEMMNCMDTINEEYADDKKHSAALKGNTACLYHAYGCSLDSKCSEKETVLSRAEALFQTAISTEGATCAQFVDYATYLADQKRYEEALPHLKRVISMERETQPTNIVFTKIEYIRLDTNIRNIVGEAKEFRISTSIYAHYLLIICIVNSMKDDKQDLETLLEEITTLCCAQPSKHSYLILSVVLKMLGKEGSGIYKEKAGMMKM